MPTIALACNIIVVSGGALRFWKQDLLPFRALSPFLVASVPAALIGGRINVSETLFVGLLGAALLLAGLRLATQREFSSRAIPVASTPVAVSTSLFFGGAIGLVSGLVGIGGGIFLAPVLYFLNWDSPRKVAAACSLFILVNSISGLTGQILKRGDTTLLSNALAYWPLLIAAFVGGQIGSWAASKSFQPSTIKRLTSVLILYVAARLLYRWVALINWI